MIVLPFLPSLNDNLLYQITSIKWHYPEMELLGSYLKSFSTRVKGGDRGWTPGQNMRVM